MNSGHRGRAFVCLLLVAVCMSAAAQTPAVNPYDRRAAELQADYQRPGNSPAQAAALLYRVATLRRLVNDPAALDRWFDSQLATPNLDPLLRDEILRYVALNEIHEGRLDAARAVFDRLGFLRNWALLGSFSEGTAASGPEHDVPFARSYSDGATQRAWREAPPMGPLPSVDLTDAYPRSGSSIAFAATSVFATHATPVALRFSAESPLTLFLNGREIFSGDAESGFALDQHSIGVELQPGWNIVLMKLRRSAEGSWRYALRITAPNGGGIPLQDASRPDPTKIAAASSRAPVAVTDLVQSAAAAAGGPSASATHLETLADLEQAHATGEPLQHLLAAARESPSAERWVAAAQACGDSRCTFNALTSALRADPGSEPTKVAFAEYYVVRNQLQKAQELLSEALRCQPADVVARKRLADVYAQAGMNERAATEYSRLLHDAPGAILVESAAATRFEGYGQLDQAQALVDQALRVNFDGTEERALRIRIDERRRDAAGLRQDYEAALQFAPSDTLVLEKLAALDIAAGDATSAIGHLRQAAAIAPSDDNIHRQLADVLASEGKTSESRQELAAALALNPDSADLRRRLELQSGDATPDRDTEYLVDSAATAAAALKHPPVTGSPAVVLADVRVERVLVSGLSSVREQQLFYIASDDAAAEYSTRSVQYAPSSQSFALLHARIYKTDGRVIEGEEGSDNAVADTAVAMYYDVRSREVRFPGLEKGDVIELDYRISPTTRINPYGDYFSDLVAFRSSLPTQLQRFVLIAPESRTLTIAEQRMPSAARVSHRSAQQVYTWEARDLPPLDDEPRGPALTEVAPYVHVSTFASWADLGRWYANLIRPQFALDENLRAALAKLLSGARTDAEKIRLIHDFVVRNTHYVALEFGIYSYKPYPVSQTYARRFGDCKDTASLMIALLRAAGIDADLALVRTRRMGDIGESPASISIFNHAIVYIPKYQLWLDGTAEYSGSRELPLDDQGAMALTVSLDGDAQLRHIPVTNPLDNLTHRTVRAQIAPDGSIRFTGTFYTRGEDAPGLRREYETPERQRDELRNRLAEVFPTVRVEDVKVEGAHDLEHDVSVDFRGSLDTFDERHTFSLATSWMPHMYLQTLAPLASRSEDLLLPAPWTTEEELHIVLPTGGSFVSVPRDSTIQTRFGTATLQYQRREGELIVRTSVQFRQLRITPAEYPVFREFCAHIERAFRNEIKVGLE